MGHPVIIGMIARTIQCNDIINNVADVTAIEPEWLAVFAPHLCTFSPPLETPEPRYDPDRDSIVCHRKATFGK